MLTYGDGVSDVDLHALLAFHRAHGRSRPSRRCGRRRASAASIFDGDLVRDVHREAADRRGLDQRRLLRVRAGDLRLPRRRRRQPRDATRSSAWPSDGQLAAYRHDDFWQCMDTLRDKRLLEALWQSRTRARGRCGRDRAVLARPPDARHRRHRPGRRLAGAAPARGAAPTSSAWCATGCRRASSCAADCSSASSVVRGDVRDQALLERVARRVRDRHRHSPRRADHRRRSPTATRSRRSRPTSAAPGRCSKPAAAARRSSRSSSRRRTRRTAITTQLPYDEDDAAARAAIPTTSASRAPT